MNGKTAVNITVMTHPGPRLQRLRRAEVGDAVPLQGPHPESQLLLREEPVGGNTALLYPHLSHYLDVTDHRRRLESAPLSPASSSS